MRTLHGLLFLVFILATPAYAQQAKPLVFQEETHHFGTIDEEKGPVTHEFRFTNNSPRAVKILKVQASCGCTTPDWSRDVIAPGKEGFVQASYDPRGRPGFFTKTLTVTTDLDPNPIILQIKGNVVNEKKPAPSDYPVSNGALKLTVSSFNMGRVFLRDEYVVREFPVLNAGETPLKFTGKFAHPPYIKVDVQPRTLAPGEKAIVKVSYNGGMKNQYGFQSDNVEIETDDAENPVKSFSVYATLEDYFPVMTSAELAAAPRLSFADAALDFGTIPGTSATAKEAVFTNSGRSELEIRAVQPNCSCVTATLSKSKLKPGESATVTILFNPAERTGTQNKALTFYSNDPRNPVQRITFSAYIR